MGHILLCPLSLVVLSFVPVQAVIARPSDPEAPPLRKRPKHVATTDLTPLPRLQPIETVNGDVFRLIADELHAEGGSLHNFSLASRTLRNLALPSLFSHCKWDIRHLPHERHPSGVPPETICHLARHLRHIGPFHVDQDVDSFQDILGRFSGVSSVTFKWTLGALPWEVVKSCLATPRITSITLDAGSVDLMEVPPYPVDDAMSSSLRKFVFTTTMWVRDINKVFNLERECLQAVMLSINATAMSLILPVESAPMVDMAKLLIAKTLAAMKSLRVVRLNLNFEDDHQAYCGNLQRRQVWYDTLTGRKGPQIINIMQTCPLLDHVTLLYHGHPSSTWAEFRTARYQGPKVIVKYDPQHGFGNDPQDVADHLNFKTVASVGGSFFSDIPTGVQKRELLVSQHAEAVTKIQRVPSIHVRTSRLSYVFPPWHIDSSIRWLLRNTGQS
ncbi:hypothetical protein V8D89_000105 [Ganoderma adspersum]